MSELRFRKYVVDNIENRYGYGCHISLVESHSSSPGMPDLDICIDGLEFKLELKYSYGNKQPELRPTQVAWFRRRTKAGGRAWLLWHKEGKNYRVFYLIPGKKVPGLVKAFGVKPWEDAACHAWRDKIDFAGLIQTIRATCHDNQRPSGLCRG